MKNALRTLLLAAGLVCGASAAHADAGGTRVTAIAGLERTDSAPGTGARDGFYYGAQLGYDFDLGGLIVGLEGEVGGSSARDPLVSGGARHGVYVDAAVRAAVPLSDRLRGFVRGGYAYHEISYVSAPGFSGSGFTAGAGGEIDLSDSLLLRGEYRYSDYGSNVRGQRFLAGIGIRF